MAKGKKKKEKRTHRAIHIHLFVCPYPVNFQETRLAIFTGQFLISCRTWSNRRVLICKPPVFPKSRSSRGRLPVFPPLHHHAYSDLLSPHARPDPFLPPLSSHLAGSTRATLACFPVSSPLLDPTPFINFSRIEQLIVGQICARMCRCAGIWFRFCFCACRDRATGLVSAMVYFNHRR
jgi:hypothetical protein